MYEELTLREHIETVAMAYGIEQKVAFERVEPLLKMFRLDQKLDWFPVHFSKGDEAEGHDYLCFCGGSKSLYRG